MAAGIIGQVSFTQFVEVFFYEFERPFHAEEIFLLNSDAGFPVVDFDLVYGYARRPFQSHHLVRVVLIRPAWHLLNIGVGH